GKDLVGPMTLRVPQSGVRVLVTSSNPALLLAPAPGAPAQSQIALTAASQTVTFYAIGFAATGSARVTADVPAAGSLTANVHLTPSGFGWNMDRYSTTLYSTTSPSAGIDAFALDPVTLTPISAQTLRPGISTSVSLLTTNPNIVVTPPSTIFVPAAYRIIALSAGETVLSIVTQPPGFTTPAGRQQLPVRILTPAIGLSSAFVAKNMQVESQLSLPNGVNVPVTVTSGDPSRLLVSSDSARIGAVSVTTT